MATGEAAVAARRALPGGAGRGPDRDRRRDDDGLWQRAAALHAASQGRREARAKDTPLPPPAPRGSREPYRPWFADGAGDELWLSAGDGGEPWFTERGFPGEP